jgi:hypothetical protein
MCAPLNDKREECHYSKKVKKKTKCFAEHENNALREEKPGTMLYRRLHVHTRNPREVFKRTAR